jgi:adenylate cyclase
MTLNHPLSPIELRLRPLLPADLYAAAWVDPTPNTLVRVYEHLRTLQHILQDYVPRTVLEALPTPGEIRHNWQQGTLMFTDLAGFTRLMEAKATRGRAGAEALLGLINSYFAEMIEIISKSGGNLLEFTGDALLAEFPEDRHSDTARAVRAGLRMQRAMGRFKDIETPHGPVTLGMRVGLHAGRYLKADVGTPRRMEHLLLGATVHRSKEAETAGQVGRVCLTESTYELVGSQFRSEPHTPGYVLVVDDFSEEQLGHYDLAPARRRLGSTLLFDRSVAGLTTEIEQALKLIEPLASYVPTSILTLLVGTAARRQVTPDFPEPTIVFVNLLGLPESVDHAVPGEEQALIALFSRTFSMINAVVEARGGVLKNVTCHHTGSYMLIYFGVLNPHINDPVRAADAVLAIREIVSQLKPPSVAGQPVSVSCQIGVARGSAFAAEIGEPRGRREFNILGDTVNTAARLMDRAVGNQILITESVHAQTAPFFEHEPLGSIPLKGKTAPIPVFALLGRI